MSCINAAVVMSPYFHEEIGFDTPLKAKAIKRTMPVNHRNDGVLRFRAKLFAYSRADRVESLSRNLIFIFKRESAHEFCVFCVRKVFCSNKYSVISPPSE